MNFEKLTDFLHENAPQELIRELAVMSAPIDYFEIPESVFKSEANAFHDLRTSAADSLKSFSTVKRDGKKYVRWFLHPLQNTGYNFTKRTHAIATHMKKEHKIDMVPVRGGVRFHFTASRSVIVFPDGDYSKSASAKTSLSEAFGQFQNKNIDFKMMNAWMGSNKYFAAAIAGVKFDYLKVLQEPLGYAVARSKSDHNMQHPMFPTDGILLRDISDIAKAEKYYLPAFSALHSAVGREIAKHNGSDNPKEFWQQHLVVALANAMAELRAYTGMEPTSPHSQNILIELDMNKKLTGRIVIRDFDFYTDSFVFDHLYSGGVINRDQLVKDGPQQHRFSIRNGLATLPDWLSDEDHSKWIQIYFEEFKKRFSKITGIDQSKAFPSNTIHRMVQTQTPEGLPGWKQEPVIGNRFTTGPAANIHFIDFNNTPSFQREFIQWRESITVKNTCKRVYRKTSGQ